MHVELQIWHILFFLWFSTAKAAGVIFAPRSVCASHYGVVRKLRKAFY